MRVQTKLRAQYCLFFEMKKFRIETLGTKFVVLQTVVYKIDIVIEKYVITYYSANIYVRLIILLILIQIIQHES